MSKVYVWINKYCDDYVLAIIETSDGRQIHVTGHVAYLEDEPRHFDTSTSSWRALTW